MPESATGTPTNPPVRATDTPSLPERARSGATSTKPPAISADDLAQSSFTRICLPRS